MKWNDHSKFEDKHAFLSPSKHTWLRYDAETLRQRYFNEQAKQRGTELHEFAAKCIKLRQRLPKQPRTLNMYVNDAIGYCMDPEVLLFYSPNCFGHADTISYRKNFLRIHDLKTGENPVSMDQLMIYAALFCLEYKIRPTSLDGSELRIYQKDQVLCHNPEAADIRDICNKIIQFDTELSKIQLEEE